MELPDTKGMSYGTRLSMLIVFKDPPPKRKDLADAAKISTQAIGDLLRGKTKVPSAEVNQRLAEFFGVSPSYMLKGEDPPTQTLQQTTMLVSENTFPPARVDSTSELDFINALPADLQRFAMRAVPDPTSRRKRPFVADYYSDRLWVELGNALGGRASPNISNIVLDMIRRRQNVNLPPVQEHLMFITDAPAVVLPNAVEDACAAWGIKIHTLRSVQEAANAVAFLEVLDEPEE